jgi:serine/threonine protein kinase
MPLAAGTKLGPYEIQSQLGAGGMGEVYRARDTRLGRDVAIKVLPQALAQNTERLERFEYEARLLSTVNHPNILAIHDVGREGDVHYLVSELLEGQTLRERMNGGSLSQRRVTEYAVEMARGLAAAHEKGVVHRDLKPDNVFITRDNRIKILDFGLAKQAIVESGHAAESATMTGPTPTQPGTVMGTVGYMSPEQVRGQVVDHRSDIFSFGAILYEMVSGRRDHECDPEGRSTRTQRDGIECDAGAGPDCTALSGEGAGATLPVGAGPDVRPGKPVYGQQRHQGGSGAAHGAVLAAQSAGGCSAFVIAGRGGVLGWASDAQESGAVVYAPDFPRRTR